MKTVRGRSGSLARAPVGSVGWILAGLAITAALGPAVAPAAVHTVEKCDGHLEGADAPAGGLPGQLRRLLNDAAAGDVILVPAGCTVSLLPAAGILDDANLEGDLDLTRDVSIQGAGPGRSVIDGSGGIDNVFEILSPARASLSGLTIRGAGRRGIRHASGGLLTVSQAIVEDNELEGIVTIGPLALSQATLRGNRRGGLDIDADEGTRTVVLTNVTVTGNTSFNVGGVRVLKGTTLLNQARA